MARAKALPSIIRESCREARKHLYIANSLETYRVAVSDGWRVQCSGYLRNDNRWFSRYDLINPQGAIVPIGTFYDVPFNADLFSTWAAKQMTDAGFAEVL